MADIAKINSFVDIVIIVKNYKPNNAAIAENRELWNKK